MANTHSLALASASSQYAYISSAAALRQKGDFTIEMWVKFTSLPGSGARFWLVDKKSESGEDFSVYSFWLNNNGGTYQLTLRTTNGSSASLQDDFVTWSPSTATWYHLAVTRESSTGNIKFYVDGSQQGSTQSGYVGTLSDNSDLGFYVGRYRATDGRYLNGKVDDLRIWSAVRTGAEISNNKDSELVGTETNLQGYYKFNNNANDSTSNGNNLSTSGSPSYSTDVPFVGEIPLTVSESITFTDAFSSAASLQRSFTETGTFADALLTGIGYDRSFSETVSFDESFVKGLVYSRAFSESSIFTDVKDVHGRWTPRTKPTTNWSVDR